MTRVHFIGIGGSGLSAIARLLKEKGYEVLYLVEPTDELLVQHLFDYEGKNVEFVVTQPRSALPSKALVSGGVPKPVYVLIRNRS